MAKKCDYPEQKCPNMETQNNTCLLRNPFDCPMGKPDKNIAQNKLPTDPHAMAEALRAKKPKGVKQIRPSRLEPEPEGRLLTDEELDNLPQPIECDIGDRWEYERWFLKAQDAKTASIIRAERPDSASISSPEAKPDRPELKKKIYDIVLAIRTEGIIRGKTKQFAESDTEEILALIPDVAGIFDLAELILTFAEHGDYSNGVEFYGADEGRVRAGITTLRRILNKFEALKSRILGGKP